jgi:hypothetical protein
VEILIFSNFCQVTYVLNKFTIHLLKKTNILDLQVNNTQPTLIFALMSSAFEGKITCLGGLSFCFDVPLDKVQHHDSGEN